MSVDLDRGCAVGTEGFYPPTQLLWYAACSRFHSVLHDASFSLIAVRARWHLSANTCFRIYQLCNRTWLSLVTNVASEEIDPSRAP